MVFSRMFSLYISNFLSRVRSLFIPTNAKMQIHADNSHQEESNIKTKAEITSIVNTLKKLLLQQMCMTLMYINFTNTLMLNIITWVKKNQTYS